MLISQGRLAYAFAKLSNEITEMQNHVIYRKKQITWFSLKTKCRRVRMSSPNKSCSEDNLERVIDMQDYNPLIHKQFRVKDSTRNAITEGPRGKSDRAVSSCCETERVKMTSFWAKSREIWSSNYSRGPYNNV